MRYLFRRMLQKLALRYDYDVTYMQHILSADLPAFLKLMGFSAMSAHASHLPAEVLYAARLRAILWDDCGPCTQLVVNMALEAGLPSEVVHAIIAEDVDRLSRELVLAVRFAERVLAHDPRADDLRSDIVQRWGEKGLITLAYNISASRVYPALKYAMGYGKACSRIMVEDAAAVPKTHRRREWSEANDN